jgi:hypothetical protein
LYAGYDFVTYFTEVPYRVEVMQCSEKLESQGGFYGHTEDVKVIYFQGIYTINENSYSVDVRQEHDGKTEFCRNYKTVNVLISKYSPTIGRFAKAPKNWAERIGWSFFLFLFGFVIYFGNKSKLTP